MSDKTGTEAPKQKYKSLLDPIDPAEEQRLREARRASRSAAAAAASGAPPPPYSASSSSPSNHIVSIPAQPMYDPTKPRPETATERDARRLDNITTGTWLVATAGGILGGIMR